MLTFIKRNKDYFQTQKHPLRNSLRSSFQPCSLRSPLFARRFSLRSSQEETCTITRAAGCREVKTLTPKLQPRRRRRARLPNHQSRPKSKSQRRVRTGGECVALYPDLIFIFRSPLPAPRSPRPVHNSPNPPIPHFLQSSTTYFKAPPTMLQASAVSLRSPQPPSTTSSQSTNPTYLHTRTQATGRARPIRFSDYMADSGYSCTWAVSTSKKGYSGVATFTLNTSPSYQLNHHGSGTGTKSGTVRVGLLRLSTTGSRLLTFTHRTADRILRGWIGGLELGIEVGVCCGEVGLPFVNFCACCVSAIWANFPPLIPYFSSSPTSSPSK